MIEGRRTFGTSQEMIGKIAVSGILWAGLVCISLLWNLDSAQKEQETIALKTASSFFEQILISRRWNAGHGGVYVPVSKEVRPNPYLEDPLRDIPITENLLLTKVNPAFMTRQIAEIAAKQHGIQFHITSLAPIRPENEASVREKLALQAFESGKKDIGYVFSENGGNYFFYMAPLVTEKGCLKCHAVQGYKIGDIRGGISITLPCLVEITYMPLIFGHLFIGLTGLIALLFWGIKLQKTYCMLLHQAVIDALTQIPNRRSFSETIMRELNRCQRENSPLVIIMCDVDNFKAYNDTYGHTEGDNCLVQVAQALKNSLQRPTDFCARYGGEEFVIILPNTSRKGGLHVAERMRQGLEQLHIPHENSLPAEIVTMSFGVSTREKTDQTIAHEKLIQQADTALYQAKDNGRNRVEIFTKISETH